MSPITREDVIRYIEGLSSDELAQLADEIQQRLGLPPLENPPEFRTAGTALTGEPVETTERCVVLLAPGPDKNQIIRLVRTRLNLGLFEAKTLVERAPVTLYEGLSRQEAEELARPLIDAGARVELR